MNKQRLMNHENFPTTISSTYLTSFITKNINTNEIILTLANVTSFDKNIRGKNYSMHDARDQESSNNYTI
jgi:hypothetical protein